MASVTLQSSIMRLCATKFQELLSERTSADAKQNPLLHDCADHGERRQPGLGARKIYSAGRREHVRDRYVIRRRRRSRGMGQCRTGVAVDGGNWRRG